MFLKFPSLVISVALLNSRICFLILSVKRKVNIKDKNTPAIPIIINIYSKLDLKSVPSVKVEYIKNFNLLDCSKFPEGLTKAAIISAVLLSLM